MVRPIARGHVDHRPGHREVGRVVADAGDERAVDLDGLRGQLLEPGQRGVAGAEVVDREPHAPLATSSSIARQRVRRQRDQAGLDELQHQPVPRQPDSVTISCTAARKSGSPGSSPARFTATDGGQPVAVVGQVAASRTAVRSTQRSRSRSSPLRWATGRNSPGKISPRSGCGQRTSASADSTLPSGPTTGW